MLGGPALRREDVRGRLRDGLLVRKAGRLLAIELAKRLERRRLHLGFMHELALSFHAQPQHRRLIGRGDGGRVAGVRVIGTRGQKVVLRELPVRRLFGNLNSGMFVVDIERSSKGIFQEITFTGGGWGHGVGMCQMGAIGRAENGQSFEQILSHYYNGAVTVGIY